MTPPLYGLNEILIQKFDHISGYIYIYGSCSLRVSNLPFKNVNPLKTNIFVSSSLPQIRTGNYSAFCWEKFWEEEGAEKLRGSTKPFFFIILFSWEVTSVQAPKSKLAGFGVNLNFQTSINSIGGNSKRGRVNKGNIQIRQCANLHARQYSGI